VTNQNAQIAYARAAQAHQAALAQAQIQAENAGQQAQTVLSQNAALRDEALKRYGIDIGYQGRRGVAPTDPAARIGADQISPQVRQWATDQALEDPWLADRIVAFTKTPGPMQGQAFADLRDYVPPGGKTNPLANMGDDAIAKIMPATPEEQTRFARLSQRNAKANALTTRTTVDRPTALRIAQATQDVPGLDPNRIAQNYAALDGLESIRSPRTFRQQLNDDPAAQAWYADAILGVRDQLGSLSSQIRSLGAEKAALAKQIPRLAGDPADSTSPRGRATARMNAIDAQINGAPGPAGQPDHPGLRGIYNELSTRSSQIQKTLSSVDDQGNIDGLSTAPVQVALTPQNIDAYIAAQQRLAKNRGISREKFLGWATWNKR
jgi:hypothetical protein